jgi:hypothetical protein
MYYTENIMDTKENKTLYIGDIHGQFEVISALIKKYDINNTTLIQVGDFGAISKDRFGMKVFECIKRLKNLDKKLRALNNTLIITSGNHDDPFCFSSNWGEDLFSNIELIKDYTVREISGKSHLFIGGAISVDREMRRRNGWFFFEDEVVDFDLDKVPEEIDVLVTHCADALLIGMTFSNIQHFLDEDLEPNPSYKVFMLFI